MGQNGVRMSTVTIIGHFGLHPPGTWLPSKSRIRASGEHMKLPVIRSHRVKPGGNFIREGPPPRARTQPTHKYPIGSLPVSVHTMDLEDIYIYIYVYTIRRPRLGTRL